MATDLERAFAALEAKTSAYNELWDYYDGDQPLVYSTLRLQAAFRDISARFSENWCAVIIDSAIERVNLSRFMVAENQVLTDALTELWERTEMGLDSDDAHLAAMVCGEAFVIVWPDGDGQMGAYYNDPRLCHIEYDAENPRLKRWAAKWWVTDDERYRLTLYYADRLEYYGTIQPGRPSSATAFTPLEGEEQAANPFGEIPVFHLRLNRRRIKGELGQSITELQDAVNKLMADMMVAAEYGAFRQRYIISNAEVGQLKNAPNEIWDLPAGDGVGQDTAVGEFSATELRNYWEAIDKLATAMGVISRTPKHYFYQQGGDPSGEALIAMEAPLNKKVGRYIERFTATWRRVAVFMLRLAGYGQVDPLDVLPVFDDPSTVQPRTEAEIREIDVRTGIPLTTALRRQGWSDEEIAQMREDRAEERMENADLARAYLEQARREFDQEEAGDGRTGAGGGQDSAGAGQDDGGGGGSPGAGPGGV